MDAWAAILIGTGIGVLTGLIPGIHVNLLAAIALTIPGIDGTWALGLVAVGVVHTFVTILPTTLLGAPAEDTAMAVLPAHRLLREGAGREAIHISLYASMLALLVTVAMLWPVRWLLLQPAVLPFLRLAAPAILVAVPIWLAARDPRPWPAFGVMLLAAFLGHLSWDWPVHGWIPGAATPLLPLLSGLFGVPTLLWAIHHATQATDLGMRPPLAHGTRRATLRGIGAAGITAVLPGLTAAVATAIALPRHTDPRAALATLSAVNTAHMSLALALLWITRQTRSGLAIAWRALEDPTPWLAWPPRDLLTVIAALLFAGASAVAATTLLSPGYAAIIARAPQRLPEALALTIIVGLVALTTGWQGLLLLATATCLGLVPLAAGVRRIHLAACLSIPIALRLAIL